MNVSNPKKYSKPTRTLVSFWLFALCVLIGYAAGAVRDFFEREFVAIAWVVMLVISMLFWVLVIGFGLWVFGK